MLLKCRDGAFLRSVQIESHGTFLVISTVDRDSAIYLDQHTAESLQAFLADIGYIFHLEDE